MAPLFYAPGVLEDWSVVVMDPASTVFNATLQCSITPLLRVREIKGFTIKIILLQ
jgi:hypothetical protein